MACEAPILAHRREAERSTRPRTPETNAKVAQNIVKHALRSPGRYRRGRPGPMACCAQQSQWRATATRKTRLAEGRSRQTNPICQAQWPGAAAQRRQTKPIAPGRNTESPAAGRRRPVTPNKANSWHAGSTPVRRRGWASRHSLCQTNPIGKAHRPVSRTDGAKQSQFAEGMNDGNRLHSKNLWSRRRSMETRKQSQSPYRMDGGHGSPCARPEGRLRQTKPICSGEPGGSGLDRCEGLPSARRASRLIQKRKGD